MNSLPPVPGSRHATRAWASSMSALIGWFPYAAAASILFGVALEAQIRLFLPELGPSGHFRFQQGTADRPPLGIPDSIQRQVDKRGDFSVLFHINSLGLRDEKLVSRADRSSLIALGDSFTMGYGVEREERYSDRLEALLHRPVYNLALPGTLADQAKLLRYARSLGSTADRVVVGIVVESAVRLYSAEDLAEADPERPVITSPETKNDGRMTGSWRDFLNGYSATYIALTTALKRNPTINRALEAAGLAVPARPISGVYTDDEIQGTARYLEAMLRSYRAAIVLFPTKNTFSGPYRAGINDAMDRLAAELGDRYSLVIDLRPAFSGERALSRYYFPNEAHWNGRGHAVAANVIAERLTAAWGESWDNRD